MEQISKHVFQINLGTSNAFVVEDNGLTLIDTGTKRNLGKLFYEINRAGRDPGDIKQIILTHCHTENCGNASYLKNKFDVPVLAHNADAKLIEKGIGGRTPMFVTPGFSNWINYNLVIKPKGKKITPVFIDQKLNDNDIIPEAGGIQVIHTPGHTAGHISLLIKNDGVLIAGNICTNTLEPALSTVYEDPELGLHSILKASEFSFDKAIFTHGKALLASANKKLAEKFGKRYSLLRRA